MKLIILSFSYQIHLMKFAGTRFSATADENLNGMNKAAAEETASSSTATTEATVTS